MPRTLSVRGRTGETSMQRGHMPAPARALFVAAVFGLVLLARGTAFGQAPSPPGQALAFDRAKGNCLTCHDIKGGDSPGNVGPPLADVKQRFPDREQLKAVIVDETRRNPSTVMPPFGRNLILTNQEIEAVIDFLYTR
jgi:sulfur-oxidizing protein SoxX